MHGKPSKHDPTGTHTQTRIWISFRLPNDSFDSKTDHCLFFPKPNKVYVIVTGDCYSLLNYGCLYTHKHTSSFTLNSSERVVDAIRLTMFISKSRFIEPTRSRTTRHSCRLRAWNQWEPKIRLKNK